MSIFTRIIANFFTVWIIYFINTIVFTCNIINSTKLYLF